MSARASICVCVPARDEAERLPRLLAALAAQDVDHALRVVICLNNTTDDSRETLAELSLNHAGRLDLHVDDVTFPADRAHAGAARRRVMDVGAELLGNDRGVLLATDADARPPSHWVAANAAAIARGLDLVGGALVLDDDEPISDRLRLRWAALSAYWREVRRIEDRIDPVPWDPPPRHGDHTGGSLAVTVAAYRSVGGVPEVAVGEDAAFVTAARRQGFRLGHPADVWTRVSPRAVSRAAGGMASVMASLGDEVSSAMTAPSLKQWRERALWRRGVRLRPDGGDARVATLEAELSPMICDVAIVAATAADTA